MRRKAGTDKPTADRVFKDIRRKTRKHHLAEEKIRIVLEGLRGEESIAALCRREGIATSLYYSWSKEFLEAGKKRLAGDTARQATSPEVKELLGRDVGPEGRRCRPHPGKPLAQKKHARGWGRRHMRYPATEKLEIIRLVEQSHLPVKRTLSRLGIPKTTFYRWCARYEAFGEAGLEDRRPHPGRVWNRIPDEIRQALVDLALDEPELSPRELAFRFTDTKKYFVSEPSIYRILKKQDLITGPAFNVIKAADEFHDKTTRTNQLWQTDFTYLKVTGWGWFYLSTILDDFSRHIVAWKLCTTMKAGDVTDTLELPLEASGCSSATVRHKLRLLSDNGSSYISGDLADWLQDQGMDHVRGASNHPQTQGKIERWHQTLKNRILLENYYLPGALKEAIRAFVDHYNHRRYHESLGNLTPADVYFGRSGSIQKERRNIKERTLKQRRLLNLGRAA